MEGSTAAERKKQKKFAKWLAKKQGSRAAATPQQQKQQPVATRSEPVAGSSHRSDAKPTPFPLAHSGFLSREHPKFQELLATSYDGLSVEQPEDIPAEIHASFRQAMATLESYGLYHFDITQPFGLGSKCARTFVTRTLVGETGITYKYLGLRMFAHPWRESDTSLYAALPLVSSSNNKSSIEFKEAMPIRGKKVVLSSPLEEASGEKKKKKKKSKEGEEGEEPSKTEEDQKLNLPQALELIGKMNQFLIERSEVHLAELDKQRGPNGEGHGSCVFNLTLINRMVPEQDRELKLEPLFQQDKCSVSWHADSSLQHYSTIAVYHQTSPEPTPTWRVALRVEHDAEGPSATKLKQANQPQTTRGAGTPPVVVPLASGATYFLLDDFNHHHQHAVLAGHSHRFASTHRVSKVESHTFSSISERCTQALEGVSPGLKRWRAQQLALSEVEFEWIRQFYIQGQHHYTTHVWWHGPMNSLQDMWQKLENITKDFADALLLEAGQWKEEKVPRRVRKLSQLVRSLGVDCYDLLLEALQDRQEKRQGWTTREKDPLFFDSNNCKPLPCPLFASVTSPLPFNVSPLIQSLTQAKEAFKSGAGGKSNNSNNSNSESVIPQNGEGKSGNTADSKVRFNHPFETEYGDHFETPKRAYQDIQFVLDALNAQLHPGKKRSALRIYDPFYCKGTMKKLLNELGFSSVIHENRDFYQDVRNNSTPAHDILLTNPPYSLNHKEAILEFAAKNYAEKNIPFLLLLPNYVATKSYLTSLVSPSPSSSSSPMIPMCYYIPQVKYEYDHPEGTGHETSPFFSLWFVGGLKTPPQPPQQQQGLILARTLEELKTHGAIRNESKRGNPRQRSQKKKKPKTN